MRCDIAAVNFEKYDPNAPNLRAALSTACLKVKSAMQNIESSKPCDLCKDHLMRYLNNVGNRFYQELDLLVEKTASLIFSKGVIRRNWTIDLSYDFSKINENIITEKIIWDYEFLNITKSVIEYPHTLFMLEGDQNILVSLTKVDEIGNRIKVFQSEEETTTTHYRTFMKKQRVISLPPGVSHFITMQFLLDHPVCPKTHYIHNAFAPREPTISVRVKADMPTGYQIDILGIDYVEPEVLGTYIEYRIPGPILTEQIIEYIFQKKEG